MSMYVTRRFLRSTMSPTASDTERTRKSSSATASSESTERTPSTEPSPRRRAPLCASKSNDEVRAPESASVAAALNEQVVSTAKSTGSRKKHVSPRTSKAPATAAPPQTEDKPFIGVGLLVDARDTRERWCEARILQLDALKHEAFVHYVGWNARHDAWLPVPFLAAHGSHTGDSRQNDHSWNGETSLFRHEGECEPSERSSPVAKVLKHTAKLKEKKKTKKSATIAASASPMASRKRRGRTSHDDDSDAGEQATSDGPRAPDAASLTSKRSKRSQRAAAAAVKTEDTSGACAKRVKTEKTSQAKTEQKKVAKKAKRQAVHVVVATTDEASERKARRSRKAQAVDMELDMDVRGDASDGVASAEDGDESAAARTTPTTRSKRKAIASPPAAALVTRADASTADANDSKDASVTPKPKPKKPTREPKARRSSTRRQSAPLVRPPVQLSETREKLAAIFRLRLQQRHELEALVQTSDSDAAPVAPAETDFASAVAPGPTGPKPRQSRAMRQQQSDAVAAAADDAYVHYHNVQQLQQYYYQQAMFAASTSLTAVTDGDASPSGDGLTGGVMDPRVIQARVDALERQRHLQQQQQLHDYYQHVALMRERNCHALAANDAFLAASSTTWQQQQQQCPRDKDASMDDAEEARSTESPPSADVAALEAQLKTSATLASPDRSAVAANASAGAAEDVLEQTTERSRANSVENDLSVGRSTASGCSEKRRDARNEASSVLYEFVL